MIPRPAMPAGLLATVLAATFAIAGCSGGGGTTSAAGSPSASGAAAGAALSPARALTLAADQARQATSFSATMDITSTGSYASHLTGIQEEQTKPALLAHQKFTVTDKGVTIPGGMETLLTSNAVYLKMSSLSRMVGKPWIKLTFASLKSAGGINFAPLIQQMQANNPLAFTQMLPAATSLRQVGTATVNGTATTEYAGTLDVTKSLTRLDPSLKKLVAPVLSMMGIVTDQFHVWVDGQHQVRKLQQVQSGANAKVTSVMVVTSINQPLTIQVPPAGQTAAMPGL